MCSVIERLHMQPPNDGQQIERSPDQPCVRSQPIGTSAMSSGAGASPKRDYKTTFQPNNSPKLGSPKLGDVDSVSLPLLPYRNAELTPSLPGWEL